MLDHPGALRAPFFLAQVVSTNDRFVRPQESRSYAFAAGADYFFAKAWGTRGLRQMIADVLAR